ncbi:MAG: hypothetical protein OXP70_13740 [Acidobacteriota bacterium]|nr:hypothetical protein [Acidobacteriota bacterium]
MPAGLFAALVVAALTLLGIGARYQVHGDWNALHALLSLFLSLNLLICYWEICLFFRRDLVETRTAYWREWRERTGRTPAVEFLRTKVPLVGMLSPALWADVWATYSQYDSSYADRRTFGFNADIANGFLTPIPSLIVYAACTFRFLPAVLTGIVGVLLCWQMMYGALVYLVSFFVAGRQARIGRWELYAWILAPNSPWLAGGLLGVYVSIRLITDGDYSVLGY